MAIEESDIRGGFLAYKVDDGDVQGIVIPKTPYNTPEGTVFPIVTLAKSLETAHEVNEVFADEVDGIIDPYHSNQRGSSRSFFSGNWEGSKWKPSGPQQKMGGYIPPEADPQQK